MTGLTEVYAYDLTSALFVVVSVAAIVAAAVVILRGSREPSPASDFAPPFGL